MAMGVVDVMMVAPLGDSHLPPLLLGIHGHGVTRLCAWRVGWFRPIFFTAFGRDALELWQSMVRAPDLARDCGAGNVLHGLAPWCLTYGSATRSDSAWRGTHRCLS